MPNLALILFLPWFAILSWAYWTYPKSHVVNPARRRFDVIALLSAALLSGIAMRWAYATPVKDAGPIWKQVAATLAAYHVFLVVLAGAYWRRSRRFTAARSSRP